MAMVPLIALGVAAVGLVVLGIAGPAHRLGVELPTAYAIMRVGEYIGLVALPIATVGAVYAYRQRKWTGAIASVLALVVALTVIVIPLMWQRRERSLPLIHDVTTDLENPPAFQAVIAKRGDAPNTLDRPPQLAVLQRDGYPDLAPVTLPTPPATTFDRALAVAQAQGWEIVTADKSSGRIEATETTRWFGFTDDVVIRLTPWGTGTRVDVRSVSRTGSGDLGRNAQPDTRVPRRVDRVTYETYVQSAFIG